MKIGNDGFSSGATMVSDTSYTPPTNLPEDARTLFVRERDAAQNWSTAASRPLYLAPRDTLEKLRFTTGIAIQPIILVTSTGVVYAAYQDEDANKAVVEKYNPDTEKWDIVPYIIGYSSWGTHVLLKHDVRRMENGLLPVYYHRPGRGVHSYLYRVDMTGPLVRLHAKG